MEDIDKIIIESLRNLNCDLDDEIDSLKQLDGEGAVRAISTCLESIITGSTFPKRLPASMSAKINLASMLAKQITDLGFKGDMGYQMILYYNDIELRRVLMFLIERLPRAEIHTDAHSSLTGESSSFPDEIRHNLQMKISKYMQQVWLPAHTLPWGCRQHDNSNFIYTLGNSVPFGRYTTYGSFLNADDSIDPFQTARTNVNAVSEIKQMPDMKQQSTAAEVTSNHDRYVTLNKSVNELKLQRDQLLIQKHEIKEEWLTHQAELTTYQKVQTVLDCEENHERLKSMVQKISTKLLELTDQWKEIKIPLLNRYESLTENIAKEKNKTPNLTALQEEKSALMKSLQLKQRQEQGLAHKLSNMNEQAKRAEYTERILEIISNIKRQDIEIDNILRDTRETQKEINTLSGQIDRSFALAEQMIYSNAIRPNDDCSRQYYKLLVRVRDEFNEVVRLVSDVSLLERSNRQLLDHIDNEKASDMCGRLECVQRDLKEIRREIEHLEKDGDNRQLI